MRSDCPDQHRDHREGNRGLFHVVILLIMSPFSLLFPAPGCSSPALGKPWPQQSSKHPQHPAAFAGAPRQPAQHPEQPTEGTALGWVPVPMDLPKIPHFSTAISVMKGKDRFVWTTPLLWLACLLKSVSWSTGSCWEEITLITGEPGEGCEKKIPEKTRGVKVIKKTFAITMSPCVLSDSSGFPIQRHIGYRSTGRREIWEWEGFLDCCLLSN